MCRNAITLAAEIEKELRKHKVGVERPLPVVGFSLHRREETAAEVEGRGEGERGAVQWGAAERVGRSRGDAEGGGGWVLRVHYFETSAAHSITKEEFVDEFLDTCKLSATSKELTGKQSKLLLE